MTVLELLLKHGKISETTRDIVSLFCTKWNMSQYCGLLETNIFNEQKLADSLSEILAISRIIDIDDGELGAKARKIVPFAIASEFSIVPIDIYEDTGSVEIAVADPSCMPKLKERLPNVDFSIVIGELPAITRAMENLYTIQEQLGLC